MASLLLIAEVAPLPSFWRSVAANPAAALGVLGALIAALVTLVTFVFNFRSTLRSQRDTQFFEALKRFGDQTSPMLRTSAVGLLTQMASRRILFRRPYFDTTLDQLLVGFLVERDPTVFTSINKAIQRLILVHPRFLLEALYESHLNLQADVVSLLASNFALRGAKQTADCEPHWPSIACLTTYAIPVIRALTQIQENSEAFASSLLESSEDHETYSEEKKKHLKSEKGELLRFRCERLRINCRHMALALDAVLPNAFYSVKWSNDVARQYRDLPLLKRYQIRSLSLNRVFLPGVRLSQKLIRRVDFSYAVLPGSNFGSSVVIDSSFRRADLHGADFSGSLLKSSRYGKTLLGGYRCEQPTSFYGAQLGNVDFSDVEFVKVIMKGADLTQAKLSAATIIDQDAWCWEETNWWRAEFRGSRSLLGEKSTQLRTRNSLSLLYKKYGKDLAEREDIDSSVREFIANETLGQGAV